jgi:hypothetical protein
MGEGGCCLRGTHRLEEEDLQSGGTELMALGYLLARPPGSTLALGVMYHLLCP